MSAGAFLVIAVGGYVTGLLIAVALRAANKDSNGH